MDTPTEVPPIEPGAHAVAAPAPAAGGAEPSATDRIAPAAPPQAPGLGAALGAAAATTAVVTAVSHLVPKHAATLVGLAFLAATWLLVLRRDEATIRAYGLSLGGLLEPVAVEPRPVAPPPAPAPGWGGRPGAGGFPRFWLGDPV